MKRLLVATIEETVLVLGITMLVLPGPTLFVLPALLTVLATKFLWNVAPSRDAKALLQNLEQISTGCARLNRNQCRHNDTYVSNQLPRWRDH